MGLQLKKVYELVTMKSGFRGRMRLAVTTGISSNRAIEVPDDEAVLSRFIKIANEILHEDITPLLETKQF